MKKTLFSLMYCFIIFSFFSVHSVNAQVGGEEMIETPIEEFMCERAEGDVVISAEGEFNGGEFSVTKTIGEIVVDSGSILEGNGISFGGVDGEYVLTLFNDSDGLLAPSNVELQGSVSVEGGTIEVIDTVSGSGLEVGDFIVSQNGTSLTFSFDLSNDSGFESEPISMDVITVRITAASYCGCTNSRALNYSVNAIYDDGTCKTESGRRSSIEGNIAPSAGSGDEGDSDLQNDGDSNSGNPNGGDEVPLDQNDLDDSKAIVDSLLSDEMLECDEEVYIFARRSMLEAESYEVVYIMPALYVTLLGQEIVEEINQKVASMMLLNPLERNAMIQSIVCKIENEKDKRDEKYNNIGAPVNGSASDYLAQYLQDMMILGYVGQ